MYILNSTLRVLWKIDSCQISSRLNIAETKKQKTKQVRVSEITYT